MYDFLIACAMLFGIFAFFRFITLSIKAGVKLHSIIYGYADDGHDLECWVMGAGFAVRNFFVFRTPFNPFGAFFKGFSLTWEKLDEMEAEMKKKRGW